MPRAALFLDRRDLVLREDASPKALTEIARRLLELRRRGFAVVVATNEPRVAQGELVESSVQERDELLAAALASAAGDAVVDRFYWCPFDPDATLESYRRDHPWRKPRPGMLLQAAEDLDLDLAASWVVAARPEDLALASAAGCRIASIGDPSRAATELARERHEASPEFLLAALEAVAHDGSRAAAGPSEPPVVEVLTSSTDASVAIPTPIAATATAGSERLAAARTRPLAPRGGAATPEAPSEPRGDSPARSRARDGEEDPAPRSIESPLKPALEDLVEELRRLRASERDLTGGKVVAIAIQLAVMLAVVMGIVQGGDPQVFLRWFLGAVVLQLTAIVVLLLDRR